MPKKMARAWTKFLVALALGGGLAAGAEPDTAARFGWPVSRHLFRYPPSRRQLHDRITHLLLRRGASAERPHLVLTAGGYGAGKSHALEVLASHGILGSEFLTVGADVIKDLMPEYAEYLRRDPATAATLVHRESGHIQIQVIEEALRLRKNLIVDGSLRARSYWRAEIERIRLNYPRYTISILSVTAPLEVARARVAARASVTHRHIPDLEVAHSAIEASAAVAELRPLVDLMFEFSNDRGLELEAITRGCADALGDAGGKQTVSQRVNRP